MPNLFDSFSLGQYFSIGATDRSLNRVAKSISNNGALFDKALLNDEAIRERSKTQKDGVDFDRERLSALVSKVQTLQARLQATYQSMLDRMMSQNTGELGTAHDLTDAASWNQDTWKQVGRGALQFSKAARADPSVADDWSQGANNVGRLNYFRKDTSGKTYSERGSYFSALSYLWQFDLHQLRYTYSTGTLGPNGVGATSTNLAQDQLFEMDAVDYNKTSNINWKLGDVIKLDPAVVFTTDFMNKFGVAKLGDIKYQNGSGYQFGTATLYAYVREVDYLPDGVTKPKTIDMITGPTPFDVDLDGVPDNSVKMNDFLTSVVTDDMDISLRGDQWGGNTAPLGSPGSASANQWVPWNGNTQPTTSGAMIWSANPTSQWSSYTTTRAIGGEIDVLQHPALTYSGFATGNNDDDGIFYWSRNEGLGPAFQGGSQSDPGASFSMSNPAFGWQTLGTDIGGGGSFDVANNIVSANSYGTFTGLKSMDLVNNDTIRFSYTGASGVWSGSTSASGQNVTMTAAGLKIKKIDGNANDQRYVIDRFGNIFDKFGYGNGLTDNYDYYDYVPNIKDNAKGNYVGNIFGNNTRVGRKVKIDGQATRGAGFSNNGILDSKEILPLLQFSGRDYSRPDDTVVLPGGTTFVETATATQLDPDIKTAGANSTQTPTFSGTVHTFNPSFAGVYMGFSDAAQTTVGVATSEKDRYGNNLNQLRFTPFRTSDSITADATVNSGSRTALIDRDYKTIPNGTKVQIVDNQSGVVSGKDFMGNPLTTGTINWDAATGTYVVRHDDAGVVLDPQRRYTITTIPDPNARIAGSLENSFTTAIKTILSGNDYKEAIKAGLMDDLMLSASATDPFGGMMNGKMTVRYNRKQERVELYQNAFSAIYKSGQ